MLRLPPPPAGTSQHQPAQHEGRGEGPAAKRAKRTLLDLATLQYGSSDSRAGDAAPASAAGRAALFTQWQAAAAEPAAKAASRLAAAHPEAGPAALERDRVQPQPLLPPPQQPQQQAQQALFDDLRAELLGAEEMPLQQPRLEKESSVPQAAQHEGNYLHERPAPAAGAPTDGGAVEAAACGKPQRRPSRGAGSTRKQQPAQASPGPASLLALSEPELDAAAAALPLPPLAEQLEASFLALSQLHEFLLRTHIQAGWPQGGKRRALSHQGVLSMKSAFALLCWGPTVPVMWLAATQDRSLPAPGMPNAALLPAHPCRQPGRMCGRRRRACAYANPSPCQTAS